MKKQRFCKNCGKELTTSAVKCKYCNAKAPLDTYEITYRTKNTLKSLTKLLYFVLVAIIIWAIYCISTNHPSDINYILLRDGATFVLVLFTYILYVFSLIKENG